MEVVMWIGLVAAVYHAILHFTKNNKANGGWGWVVCAVLFLSEIV